MSMLRGVVLALARNWHYYLTLHLVSKVWVKSGILQSLCTSIIKTHDGKS